MRVNGQPNIEEYEPEVVDFAKLCYWYNRIKEVKSRLCKKLLYRIEKFKRSFSPERHKKKARPVKFVSKFLKC
jgi:hypothetical protein